MLAPHPTFIPAPPNLVLRYPTNWTAIIFFATMSALHLSIAIPAFWTHRFEGELSLVLGLFFAAIAVGLRFIRFELAVRPADRQMALTTWLGWVLSRRTVPFEEVQAVRLYLNQISSPNPRRRRCDARIEILCEGRHIPCPMTNVPRQQALCLAMMMNVQLIKICTGQQPEPVRRFDSLPHDQETHTPPDDPPVL